MWGKVGYAVFACAFALVGVSAPVAEAAPGRALPTATARPVPLLSSQQASRFMQQVARREAHAQRPGVMFDGETGLTFDGHAIDFHTGQLVGGPRNWSAPSKESLDITLLVKAVQGDKVARLAVSPTGKPDDAVRVAIDRLSRKIDAYQRFHEQYPSFGGFLPWFKVAGAPGQRRMEPMPGWHDRAPALDNGQLAWSVYHAAAALREAGHPELAAKYDAQLALMKKNVVRIFFDPAEQTMRAEARMTAPNKLAPHEQTYVTNPDNPYYLNDSSEGLMMVHFADLFGEWKGQEAARAAMWSIPRHAPATYVTADGERITTDREWRFSSHEEWGYLVLPLRDVPVADRLFVNAQRARTAFSADGQRPGLYASTHRPVRSPDEPLTYENRVGIRSIATPGTRAMSVYAPYAAAPLALVDKRVFATWLKNMTRAPRMFGENGVGESFSGSGKAFAPVLTWDGKVLPLVAWSGGIAREVREQLKKDGKYDRFVETVTNSYGDAFSKIEGEGVPLRAPTAGVPQGMSDFKAAR